VDLAAFESEGAVVIEVRDRGPGIPPGEEERIFQKFYRATSGNTLSSVQGAGLGLPICRAIVEAHRGTIQALPRPAGGSIFRIRLPSETAQ
jgi:two-component system sensor histidine kinase KdpD